MVQIQYIPVPSEEDGWQPNKSKFCWPKFSRMKCIAVIVILVLSLTFIALTCLHSGIFTKSPVCNVTPQRLEVENKDSAGKIRFPHTRRQLPQCIIIGVRKGGTRALLNFINIHPDVVTAGEEIHFFDDDEQYEMGLEYYRRQMPYSFKGQITIEKTPNYFVSPDAPERIFRMNSSIRLLLVLRDPVERMISDYTQILASHQKKGKRLEPFEYFAINSKTGEVNKSYKGVRRSFYYHHLTRWLNFFPMKQILIVDGENLVKEPFKEIVKVEEFLHLDHRIQEENFFYNRTKGFYCLKTPRKEKCLAQSKGREHPDVDPDVLRKLRQYFAEPNEKFFSLIGRRFDWPSE